MKNNGYHYFCTSNILKLIRFNFTKEIGMNTSKGVKLVKVKDLSLLEDNLIAHKRLKDKEFSNLNNQLQLIKYTLKVIKVIKSFDFEKILLIEGIHNTYMATKIIPEKSIDDIDFLIELSQRLHKKILGLPLNIERCFSLNINSLTKEVTFFKVYISTFQPTTMILKKNIENSTTDKFLIIYFKSDINSLVKNVNKKFKLLKVQLNKLHLNQYGSPDLVVTFMHSPFFLDPSLDNVQTYILRLPVK